MYFYLDESGDLGFGAKSSKYLVIAIIETNDSSKLARVIKKVRQRKLSNQMKKSSELKGNNSNDGIRFAVLRQLAKLNIEIHLAIVNKGKVHSNLVQKKEKLYNWLVGFISTECIYSHKDITLVVDARSNKKMIREDFDNYVQMKIRQNYAISPKVSIQHRVSHACPEIGAADFVAWAVHRKYEIGDEQFYNVIKSKITTEKKLFFEK